MKTKLNFSLLTIVGLALMLAISCKKKEKDNAPTTPTKTVTLPDIYFTKVSNVTSSSATFESEVVSDGGGIITARGFCWGPAINPELTTIHSVAGTGIGNFKSDVTNLKEDQTYYVRSYATNSAGTKYGLNESFQTKNAGLSIGDNYQGGIIAYILQSGDAGYVAGQTHGLIATTYDQSTGMPWTNGAYPTIPTSTAIGTGNANTNSIVSIQGIGNYAAKLCADLVLNGYSDWYLPSKDELNELYNNKSLIGGFAYEFYWSSTQDDINYSWGQDFGSGFQDSSRSYAWRVRAVRSF